jgi:hypothetical protein
MFSKYHHIFIGFSIIVASNSIMVVINFQLNKETIEFDGEISDVTSPYLNLLRSIEHYRTWYT